MKALALSNGDLVVGHQGHSTVSGSSKIRQDLALALGEPLGDDRFHPEWGSVLPFYIGGPVSDDVQAIVRSEVSRVLSNYIAVRDEYILEDRLSGSGSRFDSSDVVSSVDSISAKVDMDAIRITVALTTLAGTKVKINRTVQP
jgi:hypothetical protein